MDWIIKAALSAGTVLLVTAAAQRCGSRTAGSVAALPTITAPTLAWLAHERGVGFAASAAVGSIASCAVLAAFGLAYALAARRFGIVGALMCGLAGALLLALPALAASTTLAEALVLALACSAFAMLAMPDQGSPIRVSRRSSRRSLAIIALTAGGLTALAANFGPALGSFATGLLASLPLISGVATMVEHATGGHRAAAQFLHGYVWGLFSKAAFGALFALLAVRVDAPIALLLGSVAAFSLAWISVRPRSIDALPRHAAQEA